MYLKFKGMYTLLQTIQNTSSSCCTLQTIYQKFPVYIKYYTMYAIHIVLYLEICGLIRYAICRNHKHRLQDYIYSSLFSKYTLINQRKQNQNKTGIRKGNTTTNYNLISDQMILLICTCSNQVDKVLIIVRKQLFPLNYVFNNKDSFQKKTSQKSQKIKVNKQDLNFHMVM